MMGIMPQQCSDSNEKRSTMNDRKSSVFFVFLFYCSCLLGAAGGCQFYPAGEYLRFVRVPESLPVGGQVLSIEVHPRRNLMLQPLERDEDASFFTWRDQNKTHVSVVLAHSLEDLVDSDTPQNVLKFRIGCDFADGDDMISAFLSVTVYVEDVNDHSPKFLDAPYQLTVDELTPAGLTIFRGISALDRDKPNTPNSDVQYSLSGGAGHFSLESSHRPGLLLAKGLDYDSGDHNYTLVITATDRGSPPRSTNTTVMVMVQDNDDLGPRFTQDVYRTNITEFYPLSGSRIHEELLFFPSIAAFDQDRGLNTLLRYDLISGNERHLFSLDPNNGSFFLTREIDLDAEKNLPGNTFTLQIQASQVDNPLKTAVARIEIEVLDLNDNLPEFEVDFYNISIVENLPNGFSVLQVMASDKDQGENGEFLYQLQDPQGAFSIDPRSGWLTVRDQSVLDREQHSSLKMKVFAKEKKESVVGKFSQNQRHPKSRRHPQSSPNSRDKISTKPEDRVSNNARDKTTYVFPDRAGVGDHVLIAPNTSELVSFVNVEVTLLDANDNNPVFLPSNLYEFSIKSTAKVGDLIGKVRAVDPDLGRNGMVLYDLQRSSNLTVTSPFLLEPQTGALKVAETPLPEGRHALFLEAADQPANPSERRFSLAVVSVEVMHSNKGHKPTVPDFIGAPYEFWVGANVGVGTSIGQVRLNDAMDKDNVVYDLLHSYHEGVPFAVEERSGTITVVDEPARYGRQLYDFEAVVSRAGEAPGGTTLITNVTIHVVDPEDERGVLMKGASNSPIEFHVKENLAGAIIGQLLYQNHSHFVLNSSSKSIRFIIANQQDVTDDIAIGQDGTLYTQKGLDREKRDIYRLTVIAEYTKGAVSGAGIYQVTIVVDDENDNAPIFSQHSYEGSIRENSPINSEVNMTNLVLARDADIGNNSVITYEIFGEGHTYFDVDKLSGRVFYKGSILDREEKTIYRLRLVAKDKGNLSSEAKLTIHVVDENDNSPVIKRIIVPSDEHIEVLEYDDSARIKVVEEKRSNNGFRIIGARTQSKILDSVASFGPLFSVPETVAVGTTILRLAAEDLDTGTNGMIKFFSNSEAFLPNVAVLSGQLHAKQYFIVNEQNGDVIVSRVLPPECEFRLNISAEDGGGLRDDVNVRIFIKDINDHSPVFKKSWYNFDVEEAVYSRTVLGKIEATDADYGKNANVSYSIVSKENYLPFEISTFSGVLSVNGELDREKQEYYKFSVMAKDNGLEKRLSSSVTIEVHVLDVNDNAPQFYGYDEILEWAHPEAKELFNHNYESVMMIPVYHAKLSENSPVGSVVAKLYANDSDFSGNGNGLLLFDIPRRKNLANLFTIDSKDGTVTTSGKLDYESQSIHNISVIASDLGSPSLSSTALIMLRIADIPEDSKNSDGPIFVERYYEVEIEENSHTPVELLTLNVTDSYKDKKLRFSIISEDKHEIKRMFVVDPRNGTLYLVRSPDREIRDMYEIVVRAEKPKLGRNLPHMIYPVPEEELEGLTKFEVKVVVKIKDVNDNAPRFTIFGRPIVAAIPTTASFGYEIVKLQAKDPDFGNNAAVRYQLLNDHSQRFSIDPLSGQVRAAAPFTADAGRVFGFDVKATDRAGADDGKSAIANVFVYVLDERRQVVVVVNGAPLEVQAAESNITAVLGTATGLDIRVRRLEPHLEEGQKTNMYIYAVDPTTNSLIDMDTLQRALVSEQQQLDRALGGRVRVERAGAPPRPAPRAPLRPLQLGVLLLGAALVLAALATALCIVCFKRNKRNRHKAFSQQRLTALGLSAGHLIKGAGLFPAQDASRLYRESDPLDQCPHGHSVEQFGQAHQQCVRGQLSAPRLAPTSHPPARPHEPSCVRFNRRPAGSKRKGGGMETSITSVHSSGQDSGIAEGPCACHSTSQSEEDSSNGSYEDSLKSSHLTRRSLKAPRPVPPAPAPPSLHASILRRGPKRRRGGRGAPLPVPPQDRKHFQHNISAVEEPVIDYDQSEIEEDGPDDAAYQSRTGRGSSKLLQLSQRGGRRSFSHPVQAHV